MFWNICNSPESMPVRWSLSSANHWPVGLDTKAFSPLRVDKDRTQKLSGKKKKKSLLQLALQTVGKHRWRGWQEKQLLLLGFLSVWILRRRTRNSITDWNAIYTFLKMWRCSLKYGLPCCGNLLVSGGGKGRPSSRPSSSGPDSSRPPVCHHRLKHKWLKGAISTQHDPAKTPDKWFTLLSHS